MYFKYKMTDPYNWDAGKGVPMNIPKAFEWAVGLIVGQDGYVRRSGRSLIVEDRAMGRLHLMGLAKEFLQTGETERVFEWERGDVNMRDVTTKKRGSPMPQPIFPH